MKGDLGNLRVNQFWLRAKDRYKTEYELTKFGAIDFGNTSFTHALQIEDTLFIYLFVCLFIYLFFPCQRRSIKFHLLLIVSSVSFKSIFRVLGVRFHSSIVVRWSL